MLRFLHQLPRALRQQWNLAVRVSQVLEDETLDHARIYATAEKNQSSERKGSGLSELNSASSRNDVQLSETCTNGERQLRKCCLHDYYQYYQRAYNQVPYTCREALGWGSALVVGLQILHLWKSGWFGRSRNGDRNRDRECLGKSLYRLAMAMPQSSGLARHVIQSKKKDADKTVQSTETCSNNGDASKTEDEKAPSLEEAVKSWRRFSDKYVALKLTQEGVQHAQEGSIAKAISLWERASTAGLDKAHYNMAVCYENGHGVEKNMEKAVEHYEAAARKGHSGSLFNLAMLHLSGDGCIRQDKDLAVHMLHQAASLGLPQAQRELGVLYTEDEMKDMKQASELFESAAAQEDVDAVYYLGICYEQGWGVDKNECKAADLYTKASRAGHDGALFNLATFFEDGKGGLPEDKKAALELFQQALQNGNLTAKEEICRLNSLLLNRKLGGDEVDVNGAKAVGHSLSHPAFTENANRNLNLFYDVDGVGVMENVFSRSEVESVVYGPNKENFPSVRFYIGEETDEMICEARDKHIRSKLNDSRTYGQLRLALANQGHVDLDVIDTCRRSSSLNDLVYRSSGDLSLLKSDTARGLKVKNVNAQAAGLVLCS